MARGGLAFDRALDVRVEVIPVPANHALRPLVRRRTTARADQFAARGRHRRQDARGFRYVAQIDVFVVPRADDLVADVFRQRPRTDQKRIDRNRPAVDIDLQTSMLFGVA